MKKTAAFLILMVSVAVTAQETINDMPVNLKESVEWVWENRISPRSSSAPMGEGSTVRENLIFDQIWSQDGRLSYSVRWQSSQILTVENRRKLQQVVSEKINSWTSLLTGYEGWPYRQIPVSIVSWAVCDASVIADPQPGEIIYTTCEHDPVSDQDSRVPANLPYAPDACSRFEHFSDLRYTYQLCPGGPQNRFDMYLWATTSWSGAVGGDWGQRMSESAWLNGSMMIAHEMGHGFGIVDFYQAEQRPADMNNGLVKSIMWAGNSGSITEWDKWMLRYMWTQLKEDTQRFPPKQPVEGLSGILKKAGNNRFKAGVFGNMITLENLKPEKNRQVLKVQVLNIAGKVVASVSAAQASKITVTSETLKNGFYIVKISSGEINEFHRINLTKNINLR